MNQSLFLNTSNLDFPYERNIQPYDFSSQTHHLNLCRLARHLSLLARICQLVIKSLLESNPPNQHEFHSPLPLIPIPPNIRRVNMIEEGYG